MTSKLDAAVQAILAALPDIPVIANLEPGQRLMLVVKRTLSAKEARMFLEAAKAKYPDMEFGIITGVDGVIILPRSDESRNDTDEARQ